MHNYQSFPDVHGDSRSLEKLKALRFPLLVGTRFLDVGCNEGFFCGYAKFAGANSVTGLDVSSAYIEKARRRFVDVQFICQSWDELPDGPFDVILLASGLHYANSPEELIGRIVNRLSDGGTLILELGIADGGDSTWVSVDRGIDKCRFPTWAKVSEMLDLFAWKVIGRSVEQKGDPVNRYVLHINRRKPVAYLLLQPPGYGKTSLCRSLFQPAGVHIVSGDKCLVDIESGVLPVESALRNLVADRFNRDQLDKTTLAILDANLLIPLVNAWLSLAGGGTFVLDTALPRQYHQDVENVIKSHGYLTVALEWQRPGAELMAYSKVHNMADAYYSELRTASSGVPNQKMPFTGVMGAVTGVYFNERIIEITGWALHESGRMPTLIGVKLADNIQIISAFDRRPMLKLQQLLKLSHCMFGFCLSVPLPAGQAQNDVYAHLEVYAGIAMCNMYGPLRLNLDKVAIGGDAVASQLIGSQDHHAGLASSQH